MKHLLIVDDERGARESLKAVFANSHHVSLAESAAAATRQLAADNIDLMLLDIMMPDKDGLAFLQEALGAYPDLPVIMVTAASGAEPVIQAMGMGAYDYISKPFEVDEIRLVVDRALQRNALKRQVEVLRDEVSLEFPVHGIVGEAPEFRKALADTRKAAETDSTVLITGESGTGKELFARYLHAQSKRPDEPFVAVHCAALPEGLMESELFGFEKGAFTNADRRKLGRFDLAGSGTLFFDEVSEMSMNTQVKLLRVLQEREFMRVGGTNVVRAESRIVAATARDLRQDVEDRRFRGDLYYRLGVVPVYLPPLRERIDDIPLLAYYFLNYFRRRMSVETRDIDPDCLDYFMRYSWPGNVRELRNIIERTLVLHGHRRSIHSVSLPAELRHQQPSPPRGDHQSLTAAVGAYESELIRAALLETNGIQTKAAARLGITRRMLKYRMDKLNITAERRRRGQPTTLAG